MLYLNNGVALIGLKFEVSDEQIAKLLREEIVKHLPKLLEQLKTECAGKILNDDMELNAKETCYYLGTIKGGKIKPISRRTLTNFAKRKNNPLPYRMVGGQLRFDKNRIDLWREAESLLQKTKKQRLRCMTFKFQPDL
jgi:hypothetical protein